MRDLNKVEEERALNIHKESNIIIMHRDSATCDVVERRSRGECKVYEKRQLPILQEGGVTCINEIVGGDTTLTATFPLKEMHLSASNFLMRSLKCIDYMTMDLVESSDKLIHVKKASDIYEAKKNGKVAVMFGFEGGRPLKDDLSLLRTFYRLGVRCIQPAWIYRNLVADGVWERTDGKLSNFGVELIKEMNNLGMIIDVSHMTDEGFWDIIEISKKPTIASHSNTRSLCDHPRNLNDDQIMALAKNGGVIGVNVGMVYKDKPSTLEGILQHVEHIVNLVGTNHVGLIGDLNEQFPKDIYLKIWEDSLFSFSFPEPVGLESVSRLINFTRGLVAGGYSDQEIEKILGGNFLRVFKEVL